MFSINQKEFEEIINAAVASLPKQYVQHLVNVAFIVEDEPTTAQRQKLALRHDQTLFGLYEGVPLTSRQGATKLLPDKITLFKKPLEQASNSLDELRSRISRTVWHEVAHYYGLDHSQINGLERSEPT
jgi:predicted Zn-dependent protease with MMP-like domain